MNDLSTCTFCDFYYDIPSMVTFKMPSGITKLACKDCHDELKSKQFDIVMSMYKGIDI